MAKRRNALPVRPHRKRGLPDADGNVVCKAERRWRMRRAVGLIADKFRAHRPGESDYEKQKRAEPGQEGYLGWWWDPQWDAYCTPEARRWQWPQDRLRGSSLPDRRDPKVAELWPWEAVDIDW
ncbi:hypothetical protein G5B46_05245 [Caulobacter sp. 602-2]|uniref:Uncharacterized protein n=1 Tax=Caulobacter sp. 602-2 TaxID=2710887 RepID=A0A6G4QU90_9CAUL|nr:hypothetical protein [Caulobacter sp. 602-2]NGM49007.1 hypothetical protein [Caulobacter sp. 602-2]